MVVEPAKDETVPFIKKLNSAGTDGWHVRFISDSGTMAGHMFNAKFDSAVAEFDKTAGFRMLVPDTDSIRQGEINDRQEDIDEVEEKHNHAPKEYIAHRVPFGYRRE